MKDAKTTMDKKKYVAFWLERYAKKEPGMPLTVVFDMAESGLGNIVSLSVKMMCQTIIMAVDVLSCKLSLLNFLSLPFFFEKKNV